MRLKKVLCILTVVALTLALLPTANTVAYADYEDGANCWNCGHYHWNGDGIDHMHDCGACSEDCEDTCYTATHCNNCGACFTDVQIWCEECLYCENCMKGSHCPDCGGCFLSEEDQLCGDCWRCESCAGPLCDDCGFCEDCIEADELHCSSCGACFSQADQCDDGDHCTDCCVICEQCGECQGTEFDADVCEECGLCRECCLENAQAEGCSCEEYCVEGSNWDEHFCESCGECFDEVEKCETCGLCVSCCEDNSACSFGMCVEDADYDDHICVDCGQCFHDVELCESCAAAGEMRCEDCCQEAVKASGCDCEDEHCINDDDFDAHLEEAHSGVEKTHKAASAWTSDATGHWHNCISCDERFDEDDHVIVNGVCSVCGFSESKGAEAPSDIKIKSQPRSVKCVVSVDAYEGDSLGVEYNTATFSVTANGPGELSYQWQISYTLYGNRYWKNLEDRPYSTGDTLGLVSGSKTGTLTMSIPLDACYIAPDGAVRCVVSSDVEGVDYVISSEARMRAAHLYHYVGNESDHEYTTYDCLKKDGSEETIRVGGVEYVRFKSTGHRIDCLGDGCDHSVTRAHRYSELGAEYNEYSNWTFLPGTDDAGKKWKSRECLDCGYTEYARVSKNDAKLTIYYVPLKALPQTLSVGSTLDEYVFQIDDSIGVSSLSVDWYEDDVLIDETEYCEVKPGSTYKVRFSLVAKKGYTFHIYPEGSAFGMPTNDGASTADGTRATLWAAVAIPSDPEPVSPVEYHLVEGDGQEVLQGDEAKFVSDAPFDKFFKVMVDGVEVDPVNYTAMSGSTDVTFKGEYTATLAEGDHTIAVVSEDGQAAGQFVVKAKSDNPGNTDPVNPGTTDPVDPGNTDPMNPGTTDPVDPGTTDPVDPGNTDPGTNPGTTDPVNPGANDPVDPGKTDPGTSPGVNPGTQPGATPGGKTSVQPAATPTSAGVAQGAWILLPQTGDLPLVEVPLAAVALVVLGCSFIVRKRSSK